MNGFTAHPNIMVEFPQISGGGGPVNSVPKALISFVKHGPAALATVYNYFWALTAVGSSAPGHSVGWPSVTYQNEKFDNATQFPGDQ